MRRIMGTNRTPDGKMNQWEKFLNGEAYLRFTVLSRKAESTGGEMIKNVLEWKTPRDRRTEEEDLGENGRT